MENEKVLKGCPFCGGFAKLKQSSICGGHGFFITSAFVECTICGARGGSVDDYDGALDMDRAVFNWNIRK